LFGITPICREAVLKTKSFRVVKPEIRVLGVDDGKFVPHVASQVLVVGVVFRGGYWLDGVMHTKVSVDGFDATDKIAAMITSSSHCKQLRVVMLNGITFAGFNVVDIRALNKATNLPIITVTRDKPDLSEIREALQNLPESERRCKLILDAGEPFELFTRNEEEKIYVQAIGIKVEDAEKIIRLTSTRSSIPEPLRVAHLIASGIGRV
jgi:endonuclease V-like protein UPF0215 family